MCPRCAAASLRIVTNAKRKGAANADSVDIIKLGKLLGIEANPAQDPGGYVREFVAALDAVEAQLTGVAEPEPGDDMMSEDDMTTMDDPEDEDTLRRMQRRSKEGSSSSDSRHPNMVGDSARNSRRRETPAQFLQRRIVENAERARRAAREASEDLLELPTIDWVALARERQQQSRHVRNAGTADVWQERRDLELI